VSNNAIAKSSWIRVAIERAGGDAIKASYVELKGKLGTYLAEISTGVLDARIDASIKEKKKKRVKHAVKQKIEIQEKAEGGVDTTNPLVFIVVVNIALMIAVNFILLYRVGGVVARQEERVTMILAHLVGR
jgi:hypothetical protein